MGNATNRPGAGIHANVVVLGRVAEVSTECASKHRKAHVQRRDVDRDVVALRSAEVAIFTHEVAVDRAKVGALDVERHGVVLQDLNVDLGAHEGGPVETGDAHGGGLAGRCRRRRVVQSHDAVGQEDPCRHRVELLPSETSPRMPSFIATVPFISRLLSRFEVDVRIGVEVGRRARRRADCRNGAMKPISSCLAVSDACGRSGGIGRRRELRRPTRGPTVAFASRASAVLVEMQVRFHRVPVVARPARCPLPYFCLPTRRSATSRSSFARAFLCRSVRSTFRSPCREPAGRQGRDHREGKVLELGVRGGVPCGRRPFREEVGGARVTWAVARELLVAPRSRRVRSADRRRRRRRRTVPVSSASSGGSSRRGQAARRAAALAA